MVDPDVERIPVILVCNTPLSHSISSFVYRQTSLSIRVLRSVGLTTYSLMCRLRRLTLVAKLTPLVLLLKGPRKITMLLGLNRVVNICAGKAGEGGLFRSQTWHRLLDEKLTPGGTCISSPGLLEFFLLMANAVYEQHHPPRPK